jgi:hypothetical protein
MYALVWLVAYLITVWIFSRGHWNVREGKYCSSGGVWRLSEGNTSEKGNAL